MLPLRPRFQAQSTSRRPISNGSYSRYAATIGLVVVLLRPSDHLFLSRLQPPPSRLCSTDVNRFSFLPLEPQHVWPVHPPSRPTTSPLPRQTAKSDRCQQSSRNPRLSGGTAAGSHPSFTGLAHISSKSRHTVQNASCQSISAIYQSGKARSLDLP